jgi:predicted lipoprotein with Yx(FWY)xxD motif
MRRSFAVSILAAAALAGAAVSAVALGSTGHPGISLRATRFGSVLVAANGRTLYLFTADRKTSACTGACAALWPPLLAKGTVDAGDGVKTSLLGAVKRADGTRQVTYAGHPLYFFARDAKAGQMKGEGFGGRWFVLSPRGVKVMVHATASGTVVKPPTTTTNSNGGTGNRSRGAVALAP